MTLLSLAAGFLLGVYLADRFSLSVAALALFALAASLLVPQLIAVRRPVLPGLVLVALVLGMLRVEALHGDDTSALVSYHGKRSSRVEGVVESDPEAVGAATRLRLRVDRIGPGDKWDEVSGRILVTTREPAELVRQRERPYFRYGDRVLLEGVVEAPPQLDEFDYPSYLARQGIGSVMSFPEVTLLDEGHGFALYRWLYSVRRRIADSLGQAVPEPQASLGQALLLGLRDSLPEELVDDFRATGTSHILAISGLHLGILLGMSLSVSQHWFGRRRNLYLVLPLLLIWLYALISGMSPSVTRAAIMGSVYVAALFFGRPRSAFPALGLAAVLMVAVNPDVLWSISFQLSFAAMAGIALMAEPLSERIQAFYQVRLKPESAPSQLLSPVSHVAAMTIAATVATLPLIAFYFQQVSLVGLPTTALTLPALPLVLVTQAAAGLVGVPWPGLAEPLGWLAWLPSAYLTGMVGLVARLPGVSIDTGPLASVLVWAYYLPLFAALNARTLRAMFARGLTSVSAVVVSSPLLSRRVPWPVTVLAVSVAALVWIAALSLPDSRLHVVFVDVGQGDAAFITTPRGQQILVDGGPDPGEVVQFLGETMPFRDRSIDLVVLTHAHSDHLNGLIEVLSRYEVKLVLEREVEYDEAPHQAWRRAVSEEGARVVQAQAGQLLAFEDGVLMEVLSPPARLLRGTRSDIDNASVVLRLTYGEVSFLLTGDVFAEAESLLVARSAP